jgi:hypothetical protein
MGDIKNVSWRIRFWAIMNHINVVQTFPIISGTINIQTEIFLWAFHTYSNKNILYYSFTEGIVAACFP